ncbi:hypothetical protein CYJ36_20115 [Bacillus sp. UMB0893]|nr:hypothetical protein CYJ36_20115 [Bacillus sp. UMB0893]
MGHKKNQQLRPDRDLIRRKRPADGIGWARHLFESLNLTQEEIEAEAEAKRMKKRKASTGNGAKRLTGDSL